MSLSKDASLADVECAGTQCFYFLEILQFFILIFISTKGLMSEWRRGRRTGENSYS